MEIRFFFYCGLMFWKLEDSTLGNVLNLQIIIKHGFMLLKC